jgi:hypothetical protein
MIARFLATSNTTIRLQGGSTPYQGRLEVFRNGVWGTVCRGHHPDYFIHKINAAVMCRQLFGTRSDQYPFPADIANKQHLGSAPKSHFCDLTRKTEVIGLSDLMTLCIDLGCFYCKQTQRAFNVFKNTPKRLRID